MSGTLRVAIIGCGGYGQVHATSAGRMPDIELVGYYDIDPSHAQQYVDKFGGRAFDNPGELIAAADVVVLTTPPTARLAYIRMAAEAGRHVLCQKPLALHPAETAEICRVVHETGIHFGVGFNGRFTPLYMRMVDLFEAGDLGDLVYCWRTLHTDLPLAFWQQYQAQNHWRTRQETSGGRVFEMGSHDIDLLLKIGGRPTAVYGKCAISHPSLSTDDMDIAVIEFERGYAKWELSKAPQSIEIQNGGIMGSEAMVATGPDHTLLFRRRGEKETSTISVARKVKMAGVDGDADITEIRDRLFYDAVLNDTAFESDCRAGKLAADVCRAIRMSSEQGQRLRFDDVSPRAQR